MYEVRVWSEDGTLMGYAEIEDGSSIITFNDVDPHSGYAWDDVSICAGQYDAESYAREWADGYADWCRETCQGCDGSDSCGVLYEHGISIQYCRDGWTTDEQG